MKKTIVLVPLISAALTVAACSSSKSGGGKDSKPKLGLILRNQGGTSYFQDVAAGAKAEARAKGIDLSVQFTDSTDQQLSAVDTMINSGIKGLIITIQDPSIGPAVATKAANAKVALLASDDSFKDSTGKAIPVVTLDGKKVGTDVGTEAAKLFASLNWSTTGPKFAAVSIELPSVSTCNDRTRGAKSAFASAAGINESNIIKADYDGTLNNSITTMGAVITGHRDVKRWVVWSCNDEGVAGAIKALANAGVPASNIIGVGLGANLACDQFPKHTGFRAAVALDPKVNGKVDVDTILGQLVDGKAMPPTTIFPGSLVDPSTPPAQLPC